MQPTAVFLIPLGCLSSASGLLLMRSAKDVEGPMYCSPRWLLGFFLLGILATMFDVIVLALLPLSVLAPFAGLTIVFSLGLARTGLFGPAEHLSFADIISTTLVLLGVTLVSAFGPHSDGPTSLSALTTALTQPVSVVFAVLSLCVAGVQLFYQYTRRAGHKASKEAAPSSFGACLASSYAAASCGTISRMMLKLVASSLSDLPSSTRVLLGGGCMLGVSAPLHLHLLNAHLASADASLAIPFYLSFLILLTTASGGLIFGEFATLSVSQLVVFGIGVAVATAGLVGLSHKAPDTAHSSAQHDASAVPSEISSATSSDEAQCALPPRTSNAHADGLHSATLRRPESKKRIQPHRSTHCAHTNHNKIQNIHDKHTIHSLQDPDSLDSLPTLASLESLESPGSLGRLESLRQSHPELEPSDAHALCSNVHECTPLRATASSASFSETSRLVSSLVSAHRTRPLAPRASLLDRRDFSRLANGISLGVAFSHSDMRALSQGAPRAKSMPEFEHVARPMRSVKRPERATTRT